ncbi:AAA family ATPase [Cuniculiplasma divulgatum]|uniref:AAA family ATPase n=1 Tax=Cuniculiplasma divulgatum TaxID=1673428 RepID=UPI00097DECAE|nr:AAA family ATPase [Cuniculiplasma divulgatum]MCI2411920.1 ATP-binding protein [Cuniculiplasma sp.]WMT49110.1 MAG: AAA family ATPase [Thermoplasmatales archaeon]
MLKPPIYQIRELPRVISRRISKKIVIPFHNHIKSLIENTINIEEVRFIPFGRTPLIKYAQDDEQGLYIADDIESIRDPTHSIYSNFIEWIKFSQRKLSKQSDFKLDTTELLQGGITYDDLSRHLLYKDNDDTTVDIRYASAMANEVSGIILMAMSMSKGIIIVEEPESQLHPSSQIIMALSLIALSSLDYRIFFSTHSNIIGQVFYLIHKYKPSPEKIQNLIDNVIKVETKRNNKIEISELAKQVSKSLQECKFDSYYVNRTKGVEKINLEEFGNGIPGITDEVLMKLLNWTETLVE